MSSIWILDCKTSKNLQSANDFCTTFNNWFAHRWFESEIPICESKTGPTRDLETYLGYSSSQLHKNSSFNIESSPLHFRIICSIIWKLHIQWLAEKLWSCQTILHKYPKKVSWHTSDHSKGLCYFRWFCRVSSLLHSNHSFSIVSTFVKSLGTHTEW